MAILRHISLLLLTLGCQTARTPEPLAPKNENTTAQTSSDCPLAAPALSTSYSTPQFAVVPTIDAKAATISFSSNDFFDRVDIQFCDAQNLCFKLWSWTSPIAMDLPDQGPYEITLRLGAGDQVGSPQLLRYQNTIVGSAQQKTKADIDAALVTLAQQRLRYEKTVALTPHLFLRAFEFAYFNHPESVDAVDSRCVIASSEGSGASATASNSTAGVNKTGSVEGESGHGEKVESTHEHEMELPVAEHWQVLITEVKEKIKKPFTRSLSSKALVSVSTSFHDLEPIKNLKTFQARLDTERFAHHDSANAMAPATSDDLQWKGGGTKIAKSLAVIAVAVAGKSYVASSSNLALVDSPQKLDLNTLDLLIYLLLQEKRRLDS